MRTLDQDAVQDMIRFNEAIDQAVAESVADFSVEAESWRQVFLGVLGHDLRGPLSVIVTTSELLLRMTQDTPFSEQTSRIIRSGRRMNKLLDDLLDYSRTTLGMGIRIEREDADLEGALREELDMLRAQLPGIGIRFESSGVTKGPFDASRVREALGNLVVNAAKYGSPGGDIVVILKGDDQRAELVVRNEGATLSTHDLMALFDPLKRSRDESHEGDRTSLGLGLFIVREIARAHGGELSANASDHATEFTMRLPRVRAGDPHRESPPGAGP